MLLHHGALERGKRHARIPCGKTAFGLPGLEEPTVRRIERRELVRNEYALVGTTASGVTEDPESTAAPDHSPTMTGNLRLFASRINVLLRLSAAVSPLGDVMSWAVSS